MVPSVMVASVPRSSIPSMCGTGAARDPVVRRRTVGYNRGSREVVARATYAAEPQDRLQGGRETGDREGG